ncbi:MAG TPA: DsbA family protein [Roseiarcus sp.]|nr:DsbA family protein [Roseiarcus sp.]
MEHKATADELDRAKVEEAIHDYILNHPEIIRDAIVEMQRHEQADKEKAALAALENNRALLLASPHQAVIGNPNGDISIVEFFDYNCPYCRQSAPDLASVLAQDKNVRVVLKEWPILGPDSIEAAKVSIAARILDGGARFQEFHEKLLAIHGRANRTNAIQVATSVGYDSQRIESEIESDEVKSTIAEVAQLGTTLNITGTPSFIAGSRAIAGAMDVNGLKRVVARARQECKTPSC